MSCSSPPRRSRSQGHETQIHARATLLERTLLDFGYKVRVVQIDTGPVITMFEVALDAGVRVSRIAGLANDVAIGRGRAERPMVSPIPGKTTVGIEVRMSGRGVVRLGEVVAGVPERAPRPTKNTPCFWARTRKGHPCV